MIKHMTKLTGWTASLVALAATASADIKVNDYLSFNGYATASGTYSDNTAGKNVSTLFNSGSNELDSVKLAAVGTYGDFGGKLSLLYIPTRTGSNSGIQDAYLTYSKDGFTVTGGKFLSYLGYEAFDPNNMTQMTYGADIFAIPGYHTGAKVDYAAKTWGAGFAVVDSIYQLGSPAFLQGDGKFDRVGYETYVTYTGIDKLTLWLGAAYDDNTTPDTVVYDFWASYALTSKLTLAGEFDTSESVAKGYLGEVQYAFTDKFSGIARFSAKENAHGGAGTYYTLAPTYKITPALSVRGEVSYADSVNATNGTYGLLTSQGFFYGVQALFTF
ncbi:MAG TPA: outer membrane beta-barrel protein [Rariglobus sp.]|jgi:hypothetical protein|nr:outer membrane beta-barrel protein [Rariglobus sp.]